MSRWLSERGFTRFCTQFSWNEPTGYHAEFINCLDHAYLKIITHDKDVYEGIVKFGFVPQEPQWKHKK